MNSSQNVSTNGLAGMTSKTGYGVMFAGLVILWLGEFCVSIFSVVTIVKKRQITQGREQLTSALCIKDVVMCTNMLVYAIVLMAYPAMFIKIGFTVASSYIQDVLDCLSCKLLLLAIIERRRSLHSQSTRTKSYAVKVGISVVISVVMVIISRSINGKDTERYSSIAFLATLNISSYLLSTGLVVRALIRLRNTIHPSASQRKGTHEMKLLITLITWNLILYTTDFILTMNTFRLSIKTAFYISIIKAVTLPFLGNTTICLVVASSPFRKLWFSSLRECIPTAVNSFSVETTHFPPRRTKLVARAPVTEEGLEMQHSKCETNTTSVTRNKFDTTNGMDSANIGITDIKADIEVHESIASSGCSKKTSSIQEGANSALASVRIRHMYRQNSSSRLNNDKQAMSSNRENDSSSRSSGSSDDACFQTPVIPLNSSFSNGNRRRLHSSPEMYDMETNISLSFKSSNQGKPLDITPSNRPRSLSEVKNAWISTSSHDDTSSLGRKGLHGLAAFSKEDNTGRFICGSSKLTRKHVKASTPPSYTINHDMCLCSLSSATGSDGMIPTAEIRCAIAMHSPRSSISSHISVLTNSFSDKENRMRNSRMSMRSTSSDNPFCVWNNKQINDEHSDVQYHRPRSLSDVKNAWCGSSSSCEDSKMVQSKVRQRPLHTMNFLSLDMCLSSISSSPKSSYSSTCSSNASYLKRSRNTRAIVTAIPCDSVIEQSSLQEEEHNEDAEDYIDPVSFVYLRPKSKNA